VRSIARAVGARQASIAVPDSHGQHLFILATYGYPIALVEHLRIHQGSGALGSVYASSVPLRVEDTKRFPAFPQRRWRYATDSYIICPMMAGRRVVGIACVTDRIDGRPFSHQDLSALRAMTMPVALAFDRERWRTEAESLAQAAAIDPVSGLFNRRYFRERIEEELQRAQRHNMPVALLMMDLDDFKAVNDAFGHPIGDLVIRNTADILRRSVRVFDVCTRFGGEEFAIVMPGSGAADALAIAERVRRRVEQHVFPEAPALRQTASVGIAIASGTTGASDLVSQADRALYAAKREGKNRVRTLDGESG
ncbi:MAG TPA: sensor domain-containing diguanylate cyclase, partial [Vicinamibacterales bacterium]|nr:sensor domain-containing diguanylate cyclase [Vicinamibacterales bacterium]